LGLEVVGYLSSSCDSARGIARIHFLGRLEELIAVVERERVNRIILTMGDPRGTLPVRALLTLKQRGTVIDDATNIYEAIAGKIDLGSLRQGQLLLSEGFRVSRLTLSCKRAGSIVLAAVGLLLSLPLMVLIFLAIRLDSPGPAIFRQRRVGKDGRDFTLYKFRSMVYEGDGYDKAKPAEEHDARFTRVGRWLRRSRLDELPQLYNIFVGDMYLIGPRPFARDMEDELKDKIPFYEQRWNIKPGATGWAQIHNGYCASVADNVEKLSYDLFYIKNISIGLDILIFFQTIKILVLGRGSR
jgi:lipopolysaccharide/colanic/teichoic acid biosynthesis glycosyltransferase